MNHGYNVHYLVQNIGPIPQHFIVKILFLFDYWHKNSLACELLILGPKAYIFQHSMQIPSRHGQSFSLIPVSPRPRHLADEVYGSEVPQWMPRCHFACDDVNSPVAFLPSVIRTLFISLWILLCPFTFCRSGRVMTYT
jgi:hypothetical protein